MEENKVDSEREDCTDLDVAPKAKGDVVLRQEEEQRPTTTTRDMALVSSSTWSDDVVTDEKERPFDFPGAASAAASEDLPSEAESDRRGDCRDAAAPVAKHPSPAAADDDVRPILPPPVASAAPLLAAADKGKEDATTTSSPVKQPPSTERRQSPRSSLELGASSPVISAVSSQNGAGGGADSGSVDSIGFATTNSRHRSAGGGGDGGGGSVRSVASGSSKKRYRRRTGPVSPSLSSPPPPPSPAATAEAGGAGSVGALEKRVSSLREQISSEKEGKRKLFHSMVKLANELRKTRDDVHDLRQQERFLNKNWHAAAGGGEDGLCRAPAVLPGVAAANHHQHNRKTTNHLRGPSCAVSLSDVFFSAATAAALMRVGSAVSRRGYVDTTDLLYFGLFWCVWAKQVSYATRFDTTDVVSQAVNLGTCLVVLAASLSVPERPLDSPEGNRLMVLAASVSIVHCLLHSRVAAAFWNRAALAALSGVDDADAETSALARRARNYAVFSVVVTALEAAVWLVGRFCFPRDWPYRWAAFLLAILLSLRVPRAFLASDFHAACSQRGILFILLLAHNVYDVLVVVSEVFVYRTPSAEDYGFVSAVGVLFFSLKLLYIDDADTVAQDHALLVHPCAAFCFHVGQAALLLGTTLLGSGLHLLTRDFVAESTATTSLTSLPAARVLACGGFSAALLSTFLIKSMHLKRMPSDPRRQTYFVAVYAIQTLSLLATVAVTGVMAVLDTGGPLDALKGDDLLLVSSLAILAAFVVVLGWADEILELAVYRSCETARQSMVHPFGLWCCLKPAVMVTDDNNIVMQQQRRQQQQQQQQHQRPSSSSSLSLVKKQQQQAAQRRRRKAARDGSTAARPELLERTASASSSVLTPLLGTAAAAPPAKTMYASISPKMQV